MGKRYMSDVNFQSLLDIVKPKIVKIENINSRLTMLEEYSKYAPAKAIANWSYTLDEANGTVTLQQYTGSETDVTVYGRYLINGEIYDTKLSCPNAFRGKIAIKTITFNEGVDTSECVDMINMFSGCTSLTTINGLENLDTSKVTSMYSMFKKCTSLVSLDISSFDVSNVTTMYAMFRNCNKLTSLDLHTWNTSKVGSTGSMFQDCSLLASLDLRNWDISKVITMSQMFYNCTNLKEIKATRGKWVIPSSCGTTKMFDGCGVSSVTLV